MTSEFRTRVIGLMADDGDRYLLCQVGFVCISGVCYIGHDVVLLLELNVCVAYNESYNEKKHT